MLQVLLCILAALVIFFRELTEATGKFGMFKNFPP